MVGHGRQEGGAKSTLEFHFLKHITNQRPLRESEPSGSALKLWSILEGTLVPWSRQLLPGWFFLFHVA